MYMQTCNHNAIQSDINKMWSHIPTSKKKGGKIEGNYQSISYK